MAVTKLKDRKPRCTAYQKTLLLEIIEECMVNQMTRTEIGRYIAKQPILTPSIRKIINNLKPEGETTISEQRAAYIQTLPKYDLSQSQIDKDIRKVRKLWDKVIMPEKKTMRMELYFTLRKTMSEARLFKDGRTVVAAIDRACKMFGLDEAQKIDLEAKVAQVSIIELQKSLDNIKEEG